MRSTDDQSTIRWLLVVGLYCFRGLKIDFNQNLSLCDRCTKSVRVHRLWNLGEPSFEALLPVHSRQARPSACDEAAEEEVVLYKFNYEDAEGEEATILMPQVQVSYLETSVVYHIYFPGQITAHKSSPDHDLRWPVRHCRRLPFAQLLQIRKITTMMMMSWCHPLIHCLFQDDPFLVDHIRDHHLTPPDGLPLNLR